jgi:23S rRNA (uracil1939-C5)-methyltransferase
VGLGSHCRPRAVIPDLESPLLLTIEKQIYGGDGLARLPADEKGRGKAVFLPFVLSGEQVEASIVERNPGFARAKADAIVAPSPNRVVPHCPYFTQCGGCHYQHSNYEHQLEIKQEILRETFRRTAKLEVQCEIEVHPSPPWNYRNRSRFQIQTKPDFAIGYFKLASRELLPVEECPISSPLINRGLSAVWQSGRAGTVPEGIREIEFFANADDSQMMAELSCSAAAQRAEIHSWAEDLRSAMSEIVGIVAFREKKRGVVASPQKLISVGETHLAYRLHHSTYRVSAASFFQTNRHLTDELVRIVTEGQSGEVALDLYAGVGLFSTALARDFHHIFSVESSQTSSADLSYNLPWNGEAVQATAEQYLARAENSERIRKGAVLPHSIHRPNLVVVDPPRSGLGESVARLLAKLNAPRITYVSCDPATLARDLVCLLADGYGIESVHLVDLFPQTYHLETVVLLAR